MAGTWFDAFAQLYEALAPIGFTPRQIDEMEVWEAASILRRYEDDGEAPESDGTARQGPERDLVAERMAYAAGTGPKPEPSPPTPDPPGLSSVGFVDLGPDPIVKG